LTPIKVVKSPLKERNGASSPPIIIPVRNSLSCQSFSFPSKLAVIFQQQTSAFSEMGFARKYDFI